jgi:hypothetical protein
MLSESSLESVNGHFTADTFVTDEPVSQGVSAKISAYFAPISIEKQIASTLYNIDADVDKIYATLMGNREAEYALAEKEALAYQAAGYTGTVPPSVQAWSAAKAKTATWATDDILAAATGWRTAQGAIRTNRLARKEAARNAVDAAALATVQAQWAGFLAAIKPQLGL